MFRFKVKQNYLACLVGMIVMVALSILFILVLPVFILNEYLPVEYAKSFVPILMGATGFLGALVVGSITRERIFVLQLLSVAAYCVLWLFLGIFLFDGISAMALWGAIACSAGCVAAYLLSNRTRKVKTKRRRGRGYR